jgi:hypothetical protein
MVGHTCAMKTNHLLLSALAGLAAISTVLAVDATAKTDQRTEVIFSHPEKYADVRDAYTGSDQGRDGILAQLESYLVQRAKAYVPQGQKLIVTFTDVDLAGDFEPWRGMEAMDIRVVKDVYPPKFDLEFKLLGPDLKILKEGKRQLRDLAFMSKLSLNQNDALHFDKALLDDWLQSEFARVKAN